MGIAFAADIPRRIRARRPAPRGGAARFFLILLVGNLFVTGAVSALLYAKAPSELEKQTIDSNRTMLLQVGRSLDAALKQVDLFLQQLSVDAALLKIPEYYAHGDGDSILRINENMNNLRVVNPNVLSLAVYFPDQRRVFIPNAGFLPFDEAPDSALPEAMERGEIAAGRLAARRVLDLRTEQEKSVVSVIKYVSGAVAEKPPYLVVDIEEDFLRYLSGAFGTDKSTELLLIDENDRIFSRLSSFGYWERLSGARNFRELLDLREGSAVVESGERYLVTVLHSGLDSLKYVAIMPFPSFYRQIRFLRTYSLLVTAAGFAASAALSLLFSRRLNRLLSGLLRLANPEKEVRLRDPFDSLEETLRELRDHSRDLESNLRESLPVLRNNMLENLLKGRLASDEAAARVSAAYGLKLDDSLDYFCVVAALDVGSEEHSGGRSRDLSAVVVLDVIGEAIPSSVYFTSAFTKEDEVALIFGYSGSGDGVDLVADIAERVRDAVDGSVSGAYGAEIRLGVGEAHAGVASLAVSFREARSAIRSLRGGNTTARYRDAGRKDAERRDAVSAPYSYEDEEAVLQALRHGDEAALERAHGEAMRSFVREGFGAQLLASVLKTASEMGIHRHELFGERDLFAEVSRIDDPDGADFWFRALYASILLRAKDRRASRNSKIAEKTAAFIAEHFSEQLSLSMLSRHVYLSEAYLSRIFHEEMGIPMKQYINSVRVEAAKKLLASSCLNVSEVGKKVGYDNSHGFLKFFKEQTGTTPKEYRLGITGGVKP